MVVLSETVTGRNAAPPMSDALEVEPTIWGFVVYCVGQRDRVFPIIRIAATVLGIGLVSAALGLWIWPGLAIKNEVLLVKLGMSLLTFFAGMILLQAGQGTGRPEVQLDLQRRELRVLQRSRRGATKLISCHPFAQLADVHFDNGEMVALDRAGQEVLRMRVNGSIDPHRFGERMRREICGLA
jgi:hypothetical protein